MLPARADFPGIGREPSVANLTELQAASSFSFPFGVWRLTYGNGNGAPPLFYQPSNSACSLNAGAGDNGSQVQSADGKCWLAQFPIGVADPREFGADPTGVSDSAAAFTAAAAATGAVQFSAGTFKFASAPTVTGSLSLLGAGTEQTKLLFPTGNGLTVNLSSALQTVHVRDLSFVTGAAAAGTALGVNNTALLGNVQKSDITHVEFHGSDLGASGGCTNYWANGLVDNGVSNLDIASIDVESCGGEAGTGVLVESTGGCCTIMVTVDKSFFLNLGVGFQYGPEVQGIFLTRNNFCCHGSGMGEAVYVPAGEVGGAQPLDQLTITDNQFDVLWNAIDVRSPIQPLYVANNLFYISNGFSGVNFSPAIGSGPAIGSFAKIIGNDFAANTAGAGIGVSVSNMQTGGSTQVIGNKFISLATGISLASTSTNNLVADNVFTSNTTAITDANTAATDVIVNNPGYNPVGVTPATYAPASGATYTAGPSPETHYLTGGTVTAVKVPAAGNTLYSGTSACGTAPCIVQLGPNETMSVTYSGAPTDNKSVH